MEEGLSEAFIREIDEAEFRVLTARWDISSPTARIPQGVPAARFAVTDGDALVAVIEVAEGVVSGVRRPPGLPEALPRQPEIALFLEARRIDPGGFAHEFCMARDDEGRLYCFDRGAETMRIVGSVDIHADHSLVFPGVLICDGDLCVLESRAARSPEVLDIGGALIIQDCVGIEIGHGLNVGTDLRVRGSDMERLPEGFSVGRDLDIAESRMRALPDKFHVGRNVNAWGSRLEEVPGGWTVRGDLVLSGSRVRKLEWGLEVAGTLDVSGTAISAIPADANIGGDLIADEGVRVPDGVRIGGGLYHSTDVWLRGAARR